MMASALFSYLRPLTGCVSFLGLAVVCCLPATAQQTSFPKHKDHAPLTIAQAAPNVQVVTPAMPDGGVYTIQGGQRLMAEAASAVSAQNYSLATKRLQDARLLMNQLSNFYQSLSASFLGVDSVAYEGARRKALEAAQMRDQATYQLAVVYRASNRPELAIPLLVEIVRSQNPTREMGQQAYRQLMELGFVDVPFPRAGVPVVPPRPPAGAPQPQQQPQQPPRPPAGGPPQGVPPGVQQPGIPLPRPNP
jgi:hypothetical protein